jgi:hypothetical protein
MIGHPMFQEFFVLDGHINNPHNGGRESLRIRRACTGNGCLNVDGFIEPREFNAKLDQIHRRETVIQLHLEVCGCQPLDAA